MSSVSIAYYCTTFYILVTQISALPSPAATFATSHNTIRNLECIKAGNVGPVCYDGALDGKPDPGAIEGKTACGTDPLQSGIVGIDFGRFGAQTGGYSPDNLCGHTVKLTNLANGMSTTAIIMDRISQNNGPQVDCAPDVNRALGGDGVHNIPSAQIQVTIE